MSVMEALQWWSFAFLCIIVYSIGWFTKSQVRAKHDVGSPFRKLFDRSVLIHPVLAGWAIALLPFFPMPPAIGTSAGSRSLFGIVAGITCAWVVKFVKRSLGLDVSSRADAERASQLPAPAAAGNDGEGEA
jgi:hypothetical protein